MTHPLIGFYHSLTPTLTILTPHGQTLTIPTNQRQRVLANQSMVCHYFATLGKNNNICSGHSFRLSLFEELSLSEKCILLVFVRRPLMCPGIVGLL